MTREEAIQILDNERPHCGEKVTKQKEDNPDNFQYADNIDGYRFTSGEFS